MEKDESKYGTIKDLKPDKFRRLTGVKPAVFALMIETLKRVEKRKRKLGGTTSKLCLEDRLLLALEYLREYRTYFHIAESYGLSESSAWRICRWVENVLIKDKRFALPGKKALLKSAVEIEVVLIDASETPVERPKRDNAGTSRARRSGTPSRAK